MMDSAVDTVIFICTASDRRVTRKVVKYHTFHTFFEAAQIYYREMIPWAKNPTDTAEAYAEFYNLGDQLEHGVVLMELAGIH